MGFPLDLQPASWLYVGLFVLTLSAHLLCMFYVLAGTAYLAWRGFVILWLTPDERREGEIGDVLRDWMPLALSATITVGVAPLLFLQIIDQHSFYTANLLLGHRFGAILPALITGFYLLYVLKTKDLAETHPRWRATLAVIAFVCFAFTGYTFAENHELALATSTWAAFFGAERFVFAPGAWSLRFPFWLGIALAALAWIVERQLGDRSQRAAVARSLRRMRIGGVLLAFGAAVTLGACSGAAWRTVVLHGSGLAFTGSIVLGLALQGLRRMRLAGLLLLVVGAVFQRERLRSVHLDWNRLAQDHQLAAQVQGFFLFVVFLLLNALWIGWWIVRVRRALRSEGS